MRSMLRYLAMISVLLAMAVAMPSFAAPSASGADRPAPALIAIEGAIGPSMANYVERAFKQSEKAGVPYVVIRLDTPGGLSRSMRSIIKTILAAPMPVICWVGPQGARAASAGTYILYACGLAAMAPGTNVGAATPVQLSGLGGSKTPAKPETAEQRKVLNDAIAYITSLAQKRGRNADWAEKAVRGAASLPAKSALEKQVINLLAPNLSALLQKIDGQQLPTAKGSVTIHSTNDYLVPIQKNWKEEFLGVLATPTLAYLLLIVGIVGLFLEATHPGTFFPGTLGAIALVLGLFAMSVLPVSWAGLALLLLGVGLIIAEIFVPSFGALGLGGVAAFVIGSIMLFKSPAPGFTLPVVYIGSMAFVASLAMLGLVYFLLRMRRQPIVSGSEGMVGQIAVAIDDFHESGWVRASGERWQATSRTPVSKGDSLVIEAIDALVLTVRPQDPAEES